MIHVPPEYFDRFMTPLVGSEEAIESFKAALTAQVIPQAGSVEAYSSLQAGVVSVIRQTVDNCRDENPKPGLRENLRWGSVLANGISGAKFTTAAVQAVGDAYRNSATVPQQETNVSQNLGRTLRYIFGVAFSGKFVGSVNMEALRQGLNPRSAKHLPLILTTYMANWRQKIDFHKALVTTVDAASGQVGIQPRYKRMNRAFDRQCPATHARVELETGTASGLWLFMQTVGDVALKTIYPRQFNITS